jgi:hypothetical protein
MNCPGSVRLESEYPDKSSSYADEGTLAHEFVEAKVKHLSGRLTSKGLSSVLSRLRKKPLYNPEMEEHSDSYVDFVQRIVESLGRSIRPAAETKVNLSEWIPNGFGTCDTIISDDDTICIVDYKYGQGVKVDAPENPQLRLYALGAYSLFSGVFNFKKVRTYIFQPRINHTSSEELPIEELLKFGELVKAKALETEKTDAPCIAGEWCKFCKAGNECRARAQLVIKMAGFTASQNDKLGLNEYKDLIAKAELVKDWLSTAKEFVFNKILSGEKVPGFKLVEGRSVRAWTDIDAAFRFIIDKGLADEAMLYERKPISLTACEKLVGKKPFAEQLQQFIHKPKGQPTLVDENDSRPSYDMATAKFDVIKEGEN